MSKIKFMPRNCCRFLAKRITRSTLRKNQTMFQKNVRHSENPKPPNISSAEIFGEMTSIKSAGK